MSSPLDPSDSGELQGCVNDNSSDTAMTKTDKEAEWRTSASLASAYGSSLEHSTTLGEVPALKAPPLGAPTQESGDISSDVFLAGNFLAALKGHSSPHNKRKDHPGEHHGGSEQKRARINFVDGHTNPAMQPNLCSVDETTQRTMENDPSNTAQNQGYELRADCKICIHEGCNNLVIKGGACNHEGCISNKNKEVVSTNHATKTPTSTRKLRPCTEVGCTNQAVNGAVCIRHGAKVKTCKIEGCPNQSIRLGLCTKHGGKKLKYCSVEGCPNQSVKNGVCVRHGAKKHKGCTHPGCTNIAKRGGVCIRHGAQVKKCSFEGCKNNSLKGGVCVRHGAERRTCTHLGCTNKVTVGGMCARHGKDLLCTLKGCANRAKKGGLCTKHGGGE